MTFEIFTIICFNVWLWFGKRFKIYI